jgi:hypothetical protein
MLLGSLLLLAVGPAVCAPAPAVRPCASVRAEASPLRERHDPPTAAARARPLRAGVAGHRLKRDNPGLAVSFHFELSTRSHGAVQLPRRREGPRIAQRGTSRAPPSSSIA